MKLIAALTISVSILAAQTERGPQHSITAVRHWSLSDSTRIIVEVSGEFTFVSERLHNPERIYFDIPHSRPRIESRRIYSEQLDDKLVKRIRVAETNPGVTRVVLDLVGPAEISSSRLTNPNRLIIELRSAPGPAIPTALPSAISSAPTPAPLPEPVRNTQAAVKSEPAKIESPRTESIKPDSAKLDSAKTEPARPESSKRDSTTRDSIKPDLTKIDSAKTEPARPESPKRDSTTRDSIKPDSAKLDSAKTEPARPESPKRDSTTRDSIKPDTSKLDSAKTEPARPESPKRDSTTRDSIKPDSAKLDSAKTEPARPESLKRDSTTRDSIKPDSAKLDSAKTEPARPESPKRDSTTRDSIKPDLTKIDSAKTEPARPESPKRDSTTRDSIKPDSAKLDSAKTEPARPESPKRDSTTRDSIKPDSAKLDSAKTEPARPESPKRDSTTRDSIKPDSAKLDSSKTEPARPESPKRDSTTRDSIKPDSAKLDSAKTEPARPESPKRDSTTRDSIKPDSAKLDSAKTEPARPDPQKRDTTTRDAARPDPAKRANPAKIESARPEISELAKLETPKVEALPAAKSSVTPLPRGDALAEPTVAARPAVLTDIPMPPSEISKGARHTSNGQTSLVRALGLKVGRVVIDPGHGGHDQGTGNPKGLVEKELVLDIAKRVGKLVEDRMGAEVVYTRSDDTFVPLEGRTALANEKKADLFLSIHANSSPITRISGVETYYLNFTASKDALDVASRENASSQKSIFELHDIIQKITLHDKAEESREFASRVQSSLYGFSAKNFPNSRNRGVKKAPFVVLIGANMPSVLAEIGFLSNTREETLLKKPDYRQKLAEALFRGLSRYADSLSHFQTVAQAQD